MHQNFGELGNMCPINLVAVYFGKESFSIVETGVMDGLLRGTTKFQMGRRIL